jgi:hypothetical protein
MNERSSPPLGFDDVVSGLLVFVTGPVLGAMVCPGVTLCAPGVIVLVVTVVVPIVVLAALGMAVATIALIPYLLARSAVRLLRRG